MYAAKLLSLYPELSLDDEEEGESDGDDDASKDDNDGEGNEGNNDDEHEGNSDNEDVFGGYRTAPST